MAPLGPALAGGPPPLPARPAKASTTTCSKLGVGWPPTAGRPPTPPAGDAAWRRNMWPASTAGRWHGTAMRAVHFSLCPASGQAACRLCQGPEPVCPASLLPRLPGLGVDTPSLRSPALPCYPTFDSRSHRPQSPRHRRRHMGQVVWAGQRLGVEDLPRVRSGAGRGTRWNWCAP